MAEPKQMNRLVRRPAGRCFNSRSSPIAPPSTAARTRRAMLEPTGDVMKVCHISEVVGAPSTAKDAWILSSWGRTAARFRGSEVTGKITATDGAQGKWWREAVRRCEALQG